MIKASYKSPRFKYAGILFLYFAIIDLGFILGIKSTSDALYFLKAERLKALKV